jgi:cytochrome P450/nitrite reductase/ring-hydroxylating ferredoxin subunit
MEDASRLEEGWIGLARADELRGPGPFALQAGGEELVAVRGADGELRAFEGRCPHQGALLAEGEVVGAELVCRNHGWRFDLDTGRRCGGPGALRSCPVAVRGGVVHVWPDALRVKPAVARRRTVADLAGPRELPVIGSRAILDLERLHAALERWAERYGALYRVRLGPRRMVVVIDPDLIQRALRDRPGTYRRMGNVEPVFRELGIDGVFSAEGVDWRPLRRLTMEALSPSHLRSFYPTLRGMAERLRRRWTAEAASGQVVDLEEDLKRFTVDVTTQLALGHDLRTLEEEGGDVLQRKLEHVFPGLTRRLFAAVPLWRLVKLPAERRLEAAVAEIFVLLRELLAAARERRAAAPESPPATFLEAMILARDDEGRPFGDAQILGNAIQILVAGEDTTALTLSWAVHELCDVPDVAAALQAEADAVLGAAPAPPDLEAAGRLALAGAVAQETMRLRPVAPLIIIETNLPTQLGDLELPAGQRVCLLMRRPALAEDHFHEPQAFRPARWLDAGAGGPHDPGAGGPHDPGALMPFGSGPRLCPGRSLALLEMRVVLGTLFHAFDVERVGERRDVEERFAFTMGPRGLRVRLHRRGVA